MTDAEKLHELCRRLYAKGTETPPVCPRCGEREVLKAIGRKHPDTGKEICRYTHDCIPPISQGTLL